ncbi:hypothetical protein [Streptomyces orinoci]|uniref:Uncharacterized protein n=1 Tax=Streptomyces orinoci TaxID=67339 RepID=A0ABV3K7U0_STRON|nr:hypothetical protein [Streptomyces orinoci]
MSTPDQSNHQKFPKGTLAMDNARGRIGQVMDHLENRIQLRPVQGGLEWDATLEDLRPATPSEELSAKVKAINSAAKLGG